MKSIKYKIIASEIKTISNIFKSNPMEVVTQMFKNLGWNLKAMTERAPAFYENLMGSEHKLLDVNVLHANQVVAAVAALNTVMFGGWGRAEGSADKQFITMVKELLDGAATHAIHESLYFMSNMFPDNFVYFIQQGEGSAEKAGSEAGAPALTFGAFYANPKTSQQIEPIILNYYKDKGNRDKTVRDSAFSGMMNRMSALGVDFNSIVLDTLENTSRAAKGQTGAMSVIHFIGGPLAVEEDYEGYGATVTVDKKVANRIPDLSPQTPLKVIVEAIQAEYPGIKTENIEIYTLEGASRVLRLGSQWNEQADLAIGRLKEGDIGPYNGLEVFTSSGTYAPNFMVGLYIAKDGEIHYLINAGYAAQAESLQGLYAAVSSGRESIMQSLLKEFPLPMEMELEILKLDPKDENFSEKLDAIIVKDIARAEEIQAKIKNVEESENMTFESYVKSRIQLVNQSGYMAGKPMGFADTLLNPEQASKTPVVAVDGFMSDDPYSNNAGVLIAQDTVVVKTRISVKDDKGAIHSTTTNFVLSPIVEEENGSPYAFSFPEAKAMPLLERFLAKGWDSKQYEFKNKHAGQIKTYLNTNLYNAISSSSDGKIILDMTKAHNVIAKRFSEKGAVEMLSMVRFMKQVGGTDMDWLIVKD